MSASDGTGIQVGRIEQLTTRAAEGTGVSNPALIIQVENFRRVLNKIHRELEPGNDAHSTLINLVNHADTLAENMLAELTAR